MATEQQLALLETLDVFMTQKGWSKGVCATCSNIYYFKPQSELRYSCGRERCGGAPDFLLLSKSKRPTTPEAVYDRMATYFAKEGYKTVPALNISDAVGMTDLVIAGVQIFDKHIHHGESLTDEQMFVGQPCVRMQFQDAVATKDGTSTAFVNVCTEKAGQTVEGHLQTVDHWFGVLSSLGLHMKDFTIVARFNEKDWGTGAFSAFELFFHYGNLELGDASYIRVPTRYGSEISISDIGFGLERIAWALNKTPRYYDLLMPGIIDLPREVCDAFRSITLLALGGVQPSIKGPGLQLRRFAKALSDQGYGLELQIMARYYLNYWAHFAKPVSSPERVYDTIQLEIDRFLNLRICEKLGLPPPRDETTEDYFHRLVYTHGMNAQELRQAIKICKK